MKSITLLLVIVSWQYAFAQISNPEILINSSDRSRNEIEKWVNVDFDLIDSVSLDDFDIFIPHALAINNTGMITLMAWDDRSIYLFKEENMHEPVKLRTRKGRGPREYADPFDMFLSNEYLVIGDINLRKIDLWNITEQELETSFTIRNKFIKPDQISWCLEGEKETIYALSSQYGFGNSREDEGVIHKFVKKGNEFILDRTFQKLLDEKEMYAYAITGDINCSRDGGIVYSADFSGSIRKYNEQGELMFYRNAAGFEVEEPLFLQPNENQTWANPKAPRINGEIFEIKDKIFVARSRTTDRDLYGFDVYNADTGDYIHSFSLKNKAEDIAISENKIYSVEYRDDEGFDLKVYKYEIITE